MMKKQKTFLTFRTPAEGLSYGSKQLFPGLNFEWKEGEAWGVLGPNGSGKSVFIHLMAGIMYKREADIEYFFDGPREGDDPDKAMEVISLEQQATFLTRVEAYVQMRWNSFEEESTPSVRNFLSQDSVEQLAFYERIERTERDKAQYAKLRERVVEKMNLGHLLERRFASLSNGESRRTLVARALLARPKFILFDAPYIGLDTQSCEILRTTMDELIEAKVPHVMVATVREEELPAKLTHIIEFSESGEVLYQGPVKGRSAKKVAAGKGAKAAETSKAKSAVKKPTQFKLSGPETNGTKLVEMRDLHVQYGETTIIDGLNWTVRVGERWLLTGPNGCGKSTLLAFIIGDHPQSYSNDVRLFGRRRGTGESIWSIKKRIGWVSPELHSCISRASSALDIVLSGFVDTPLYTGGRPTAHVRRAKEELKRFGLLEKADSPFGSFSGGEQRLLLLARAIVKKPKLLVLDEPCQNLDAENRDKFVRIVDELCRDPEITLLYVTHISDTIPSCITHYISKK